MQTAYKHSCHGVNELSKVKSAPNIYLHWTYALFTDLTVVLINKYVLCIKYTFGGVV